MGYGLEVFDENGGLALNLSDSLTLFVGKYNITANNTAPKLVVKDPIFLTNTAFFCRRLDDIYGLMYSGFSDERRDIIETQVGDTYTLQFPKLRAGTNFDVYIGAY